MSSQSTCETQKISAFLSDELSEDAKLQLLRHLDYCATCRANMESIAAGPEVWEEFGLALQDTPLDLQSLSSSPDQPSSDLELEVQQIIDHLSPTDDPTKLGRLAGYEVSGVVGFGGMGVVLKAQDRTLDRIVAIKVLAPHLAASSAARKRFARESKAAAAVLHPNVIPIYSVANEGKLPYLVMPYVPGKSLQKRIDEQGPLPIPAILRIGAQVASGLAAAHEQGLVHRDIKPANILLGEGIERAVITDFGLARAIDDASMTRSGVIAGTPEYMSPEQARGEPIDKSSDLFSLGSLLYAMCTGHSPFRAETSFGVLHRITHESPRPIQDNNPDVPIWLCNLVQILHTPAAEQRPSSASEVEGLLRQCVAHIEQPLHNSVPESLLTKKASTSRTWAVASVVALVSVLRTGTRYHKRSTFR